MAGLTLRTTSLAKAGQAMKAGRIDGTVARADRLIVPAAQAINTVLEFIE